MFDINTIETASKITQTQNLSRIVVNSLNTVRYFSTKTRNLFRNAVNNGIAARRFRHRSQTAAAPQGAGLLGGARVLPAGWYLYMIGFDAGSPGTVNPPYSRVLVFLACSICVIHPCTQ